MIQTLDRQAVKAAAPKSQSRNTYRPWWQNLITFCVSLGLGLLALECYFNFSGVGNEEFLEPDKTLGIRHIAGKKVVWRLEGYSDEHLSSQGLRDSEHALAKAPGVYRIALLGDSATEGMQVALQDTYGKQLEQVLNERLNGHGLEYEVLNFGCSSYSNGQETLQLETQVAKFKPDLVIMMYNRGDYIENIRDPSTMKAEPRPYFHMDETGTKLLQDNTIMEFNAKGFEPNPLLDFLRRQSRIYGVLTHMNLALSLNEPLYSKMRNSILKLLPGAKEHWKRVTAPYTIQDPWKVTEAVIDRANASSQKMGAEFMLVSFPNSVKEKLYAEQIAKLEAHAKSERFPFVDLSPSFAAAKDPKGLFLKYHFSAAGHKLAAEKIAERI